MHRHPRLTLTIATLFVLSACSTTSVTTSTFDGPKYSGPAFSKALIIGVADNYSDRAEFERALASELRSGKAEATPIHTVVERNTEINRETLETLIAKHGFDSVLITQVVNREAAPQLKEGSSETKVVRKGGSVIDLFRYDYEEINEPDQLTLAVDIIIMSELFSAATSSGVWAVESDIPEHNSTRALIADAVDAVAGAVRKDRLIAK